MWFWLAGFVAVFAGAAWLIAPRTSSAGVSDANSRAAPTLGERPRARRLFIVGGTSGVGLETVKLALARGHRVTVMSRRGQLTLAPTSALQVVQGDIRDSGAVLRGLQDQDAVIICVSAPPGRTPMTVFSEGARHVLSAMREANVQRLLFVSGIGAGDSAGHGGFGYDRIIQPLLLAENYKDKERAEALIRASEVCWTIVRPGFLNNAPSAARYRVVHDVGAVTSGAISRADVAHYLLAAVEAALDERQIVLLTNE